MVDFVGYLAISSSAADKPGVLIFHEAPGLVENPKRCANMLTELGYVALAADLYGDGSVAQTQQEVMELMHSLQNDAAWTHRHSVAALHALKEVPEVDETHQRHWLLLWRPGGSRTGARRG